MSRMIIKNNALYMNMYNVSHEILFSLFTLIGPCSNEQKRQSRDPLNTVTTTVKLLYNYTCANDNFD